MPEGKHTTQEQIDEMRRELQREKQKAYGAGTRGGRRSKSSGKRKLAAKAAGWVVFTSIVLVLGAAIVSINVTKNRGGIPSLPGGYQLFVVESGSMEPTFKVGVVILSRKPKDANSLKANDVVTFRTLSGSIVTHRIIEVTKDEKGNIGYRTKGDNPKNSVDRELLTPDRVIAVFLAKVPLTDL